MFLCPDPHMHWTLFCLFTFTLIKVCIWRCFKKDELDEEFQKRLKEHKAAAVDRTAKKRAKRWAASYRQAFSTNLWKLPLWRKTDALFFSPKNSHYLTLFDCWDGICITVDYWLKKYVCYFCVCRQSIKKNLKSYIKNIQIICFKKRYKFVISHI